MLLQPTIIKSVTHPLIANAFIKHNFNTRGQRTGEEVLVIDAHHPAKGQSSQDVHAALIADMDLILEQVQRKAIKIDSIEIRVH